MMSKQHVLVLCERAPWIHENALPSRARTLIAALGRVFAVDVVTREPSESAMPPAFARHVASCATLGYDGRRGEHEVREYVADQLGRFPYAAIHTEFGMASALPKRDAIPIVYDAQPAPAPPGRLDALLGLRSERRLLHRASLVLVSAASQIDRIAEAVPDAAQRITVVPDVVDADAFATLPPPPRVPVVLVAGGAGPRADAAGKAWFEREIVPILGLHLPNARITYACDEPLPFERLLAQAAVVAVPARERSVGARLRILGAWWAQRPVVTTPAGADGLTYERNRDLLVADDARIFAQRIVDAVLPGGVGTGIARQAARRARQHDAVRAADLLLTTYGRFAPPLRTRLPTISEEFVTVARS